MNKKILCVFAPVLVVWLLTPALASGLETLLSPEKGVLCDHFMCADKKGVSLDQTKKHLGKKAGIRLFSQGDFNPTEFTFANGVFCDVKERLCRNNRYFGKNGKRSGAVSAQYTRLLFQR